MIALSEAGRDDVGPSPACGGNTILDLALCLILSVTVIGLLLVAL